MEVVWDMETTARCGTTIPDCDHQKVIENITFDHNITIRIFDLFSS